MIQPLIEKHKEFIQLKDELRKLTDEKTKEIQEYVERKLGEVFGEDMFDVVVPLSGGIFVEEWKPSINFDRIGTLAFHEFYYSSIEDLREEYPDVINWDLLLETCENLSKELTIKINITR
jgi:hypothetical protein